MNNYISSQNETDASIDVLELLQTIWKKKLPIICLAIAAAFITLICLLFFTPDTYTARGELYISNKSDVITFSSTGQQLSDIESSRKMSQTSVRILKTGDFLDHVRKQILKDTGREYSRAYIGSRVSIAADDTEILTISVTAASPVEVTDIANTFLKCAPDYLNSIFNTGVKIVDHPQEVKAPNSKHILRNAVIAACVGAVLGIAGILIFTLFDKKVHNGAEASKRYDLPLLGEVPR